VEISSGAALFFPILYFFDTEGWFAAALPAVLCHELGHLLSLRLRGGRARALRLDVTGLSMEISPFTRRRDELLCTAAGPLGGLLWVPAALWIGGPWGEKSALSALALNLFNLLPALPLDGGRMLSVLLPGGRVVSALSLFTGAALACAAVTLRLWGLTIPAALIIKTALTA